MALFRGRVLVIPGWYPSERSPANGDFIYRQIRLIRQEGLYVDLCYADLSIEYLFDGNITKTTHSEFSSQGSDYILSGPFIPKSTEWTLRRYIKKFVDFILKTYTSQRPDIIHAHTYLGAAVGTILKNHWACPLVVTEHYTGWLDSSITGFHKQIGVEAFKNTDILIVVSSALANALKSYHPDIKVLPNFIDTDLFHPASTILPDRKIFSMVAIGELIERKQYSILIEACQNLSKSLKNWKLTIVGDGPLAADLKKQAYRSGIVEKVHFVGRLSESGVRDQLRQADVLVHSSRLETFGIVFIEALCSGVPVIAGNIGGAVDILDESNSILIEEINPNTLKQAIIYCASIINRLNREEISHAAQIKYGAGSAAVCLSKVYDGLLGR